MTPSLLLLAASLAVSPASASAHPRAADANVIVTLDATGDVGRFPSLALDQNGFPIVSYWDASNEDLKLAICSDAACSGPVAISTLDDGRVGGYTSLALLRRTTPAVSYFLGNLDVGGSPAAVRCADPTCADRHRVIIPSTGRLSGLGTSMRFDANGNQVISYVSTTLGLLLTRCDNRVCSSSRTVALDANTFGVQTSLQLDSNGYPVIAYAGFDGLHIIHCRNPECDPPGAISPAYPMGQFGWQAGVAMVLDHKDRPVVAFHWWDGVTTEVQILRCHDTDCSRGRTILIDVGVPMTAAGIDLDTGNLPVIAYASTTKAGLAFVRCDTFDCRSKLTTTPDITAPVGDAAMTLDATGHPVIAYYSAGSGDLRLIRCVNTTCT